MGEGVQGAGADVELEGDLGEDLIRRADEALYTAKRVLTGDPIIAYCRIGERSSHTWFVLQELLGHENVKNYDGSWTEYGSLVGVPVELGEGK